MVKITCTDIKSIKLLFESKSVVKQAWFGTSSSIQEDEIV